MIMYAKTKIILKYFVWLALLILAAGEIIAWTAAGRLLHPDRRPLQDYQREWLRHPASHGLLIHVGQCAQGKAPCLFVAPDKRSGLKERGNALRKQMSIRDSRLLPYGQTQGILVLLHGRSGRKEDLLPVAERFAAAGFKCVIPDLPSHGDSPLNGAHFATSAFERDIPGKALADARAYFDESNSPAGIWGVSMGGAFVIQAISRAPDTWRAAVIVSSFDSLEGVVEDKLAFLPRPLSAVLSFSLAVMSQFRGGLIVRDVHPDVWAERVTTPVLIAHGDRDQVIAVQRGKHLFSALHSHDKSWLIVPGATHRNVLTASAPLYASMSEWFIAHVR